MPSRVVSAVLQGASTSKIFLRYLVEGELGPVVRRQICSKLCSAPSEELGPQHDRTCAGVI